MVIREVRYNQVEICGMVEVSFNIFRTFVLRVSTNIFDACV